MPPTFEGFPTSLHLSPLSLSLSLGFTAVYHCLEIPFLLSNLWDVDVLKEHDPRVSYHFTDKQSQYCPKMTEDHIYTSISIRVLFFGNEASAIWLTRRESTVTASSQTPIKDEEKQDQVVLTFRLQRFQKRWCGLSWDACFIMWPTGTLEKEGNFNMIVAAEQIHFFNLQEQYAFWVSWHMLACFPVRRSSGFSILNFTMPLGLQGELGNRHKMF